MGRFDAPGYGRGRAGRGRHPGGRGVGFGPGRGNGGARGPSIASSSYQLTAEQKEAMLVPFLRPSPRALVPVPLEFESVRHFCDLIANNLLAEFWHLIQEGPRGPAVKATPAAGGGLRVTSGDATGDGENAAHHLLLIERRLHLVVSQSGGTVNAATGEKTPCVLQLRPKLQGAHQGPVRSFGYVGAFVAELAALQELALRDARGEAGSPALRAMLKPREAVAGHWHPPPLPEEDFALIAASRGAVRKVSVPAKNAETSSAKEKNAPPPETDEASSERSPLRSGGVGANQSQRAAVCALRHALEKIQGPPGTGKSTTIYHVITQRVPPGARVLVTCSRNVAIESIAQKLRACDAEMLVVGAPGRIGATARKHLLDAKIESHPKVRAVAAASLGGFQSKAALSAAESVRGDLMSRCRLILCTIASTSRLLREWEEFAPHAPLDVHTVIVDECGCTPESSTALLLNLRPRNLVLLGDHNQLPPCSVIDPRELKNTGHDRSALERCVLGSGAGSPSPPMPPNGASAAEAETNRVAELSSPACHRLTEQYRMHPTICEVVSRRFYEGTLTTAPEIARERVAYFERLAEKEKEKRSAEEDGEDDDPSATSSSDASSPDASAADSAKKTSPRVRPTLSEKGKKRLPSPRKTDATAAGAAARDDSARAMVWVQVHGREETPEEGTSYVNRAEVTATVAAARRVRERHGPKAAVAALTFYKGQYLALMNAMPASLGVECLTVDACQGSEFDFVLISTTRANDRRAVGFVSDPRRINVAISRAKRQCVVLGDARTMAGRPGTDWHAVASMCHRETFVSGSRSACRWYAEPEAPGFVSVMHKRRAEAKLPAESDDKKEEEAAGVNVGAAAFVPKAVLRASEAAAKAAQQMEKLASAKERKKLRKKNAARVDADAQRGGRSVTHGGMMTPPGHGIPNHFPALGAGGGAPPGSAPAATRTTRTMMMPRKLAMASSSTRRTHAPAFPATPPPMPPPMPPGDVPGAALARAPSVDDDEDWEPPAGRLGSALNLRELDVLVRSESAGSFDAATQNFATPPEWIPGTGSGQPPAFSFGDG